jgi:hypothetical protein
MVRYRYREAPMTYSVNDDPLVWVHRAEQARVMANQCIDPGARKTMFFVAAAYEEMAKRAEQRVEAT